MTAPEHIQRELAQENDQYRAARLQKLIHLAETVPRLFPSKYTRSHDIQTILENYDHLEAGEETTDRVRIAGRIRAYRNSGMFMDLHDTAHKIQIFTHKNEAPSEAVDLVKLLDIGDIIGVEGYVRRTPRGELTVNAQHIAFLTKALKPLPEKYHGVADRELCYRQRYLDLIMGGESRTRLRQRSQITRALRTMLQEQDFLEVETPMLHPIAGGAIARPFVTHHNALDADLYLRIAPELYLKKLMVGGLHDRIFDMNRCFRNEGISTRHNPEFTQAEIYQAYADYHDIMDLTEALMRRAALSIHDNATVIFDTQEIDFSAPFQRRSMCALILEYGKIDFLDCKNATEAYESATAAGVEVALNQSWGHIVEAAFEHFVESHLVQPTHVTDLPRDISPLAKVHPEDERLTERFETYINGWEVANGFSELNDAIDQRLRFEAQAAARASGDDEAHEMDYDFIRALEYGLPPTGGLGIGIDRLTMILTNAQSIRDVIAFPTLKPEKGAPPQQDSQE